jgi:hypothetical protein
METMQVMSGRNERQNLQILAASHKCVRDSAWAGAFKNNMVVIR